MAKKPRIKQTITEATAALRKIMQENLAEIANEMIEQVMVGYRNLIPSKRLDAIKNVTPNGIMAYKAALKNAVAVIAADAIKQARREVPRARNVRLAFDEESIQLGEFESLPSDVQARIISQISLLTGTQISDLERAVFFQYTSSVNSTDSESLLYNDLEEAAQEYLDGNTVQGAASATGAQIINEARLAFFSDDSVEEEIDAYEFVNEDPVSEICQDLAGTVFDKDDPDLNRYWPPLHFNCKSWIRPILKGNLGDREIEDLGDQVSQKGEDSIGFSEKMVASIFKPGSRIIFQLQKNSAIAKGFFGILPMNDRQA